MKAWQSWYQRGRVQRALARWHAEGHIDADVRVRECAAVPAPTTRDWLRFWRDAAAWLGIVLLCSALVCLVAANWSRLSPGVRMGGVQALLVLATVCAAVGRWPAWVRTLAIGVACVSVGAWLALIGQTYQTGADPWGLFALWAVLMVPWALASGAVAVWLLVLAVANVGLRLWSDIYLGRWQVMLAFIVANGLALLIWERLRRYRPSWDPARHGARVLAGFLVIGAALIGMGERFGVTSAATPALALWLLHSAAVLTVYRWWRPDVIVLALWVLSALSMFTLYTAWWFVSVLTLDTWIVWPVVAALVLGAAAASARWLRGLAHATEAA